MLEAGISPLHFIPQKEMDQDSGDDMLNFNFSERPKNRVVATIRIFDPRSYWWEQGCFMWQAHEQKPEAGWAASGSNPKKSRRNKQQLDKALVV